MTDAAAGAGRRVALVLGAGGARDLAHIGAIGAIEARGLQIVSIAGSSMGPLVGGIYAAGRLPAYREWTTGMAARAGAAAAGLRFGHPAGCARRRARLGR